MVHSMVLALDHSGVVVRAIGIVAGQSVAVLACLAVDPLVALDASVAANGHFEC